MKFEMGDMVVCIKDYEKLKVGGHYKINGCGNLTCNAATDLDGYGFCIQYEEISNWKLPYKDRVAYYYFTEDSMCEYFIDEERGFKRYLRDLRDSKINTILND
jgi:hypothetical protein